MAKPAIWCRSIRTRSPAFPADPEKFARDLAARINRLLQDPEKCRRFGDAGRRRVEEIFSWTAIAQQTIHLYQQLIEQAKAQALSLDDQHTERP